MNHAQIITTARKLRSEQSQDRNERVLQIIFAATCEVSGLAKGSIIGQSRYNGGRWGCEKPVTPFIADYRHIAMYLTDKYTNWKDGEIAPKFNRERTANIWVRNKIDDMYRVFLKRGYRHELLDKMEQVERLVQKKLSLEKL